MTIKSVTNKLAIANQPLKCANIIMNLLAGLDLEYNSIISMITHCDNSLTLEDIYSMLLTYEARM